MPWDFDMEPEPTEMLRLNEGKPRLSLLPTSFVLLLAPTSKTALMYEVANVMDFGSKKYAMNNWRKSGPWLKVLDSGLRHLDKMMFTNEQKDPESGIHHAGHLGCNLAFLLEFIREGDGEDDRYVTKTRTQGFPYAGLTAVHSYLMDWKDGGPHQSLERATLELNDWYYLSQQPPAAPPIPF